MTYSAMLFAVVFDLVIWGTVPGLLSILGSTLILGSAIYVAIHKDALQSGGQDSKDEESIPLCESEE
jgi:drug/metabolite transporter (DMT)-like permease